PAQEQSKGQAGNSRPGTQRSEPQRRQQSQSPGRGEPGRQQPQQLVVPGQHHDSQGQHQDQRIGPPGQPPWPEQAAPLRCPCGRQLSQVAPQSQGERRNQRQDIAGTLAAGHRKEQQSPRPRQQEQAQCGGPARRGTRRTTQQKAEQARQQQRPG